MDSILMWILLGTSVVGLVAMVLLYILVKCLNDTFKRGIWR